MRKLILAFAASLMLSTSAHAQFATIDIANLIQSIMSVLSTFEQEATQAEQLMNQYQQLENEYRQLKSLASGDVSGLFGTVRTAYANQQSYYGAVRGMYGDLSNAKTVATDLYNRMGASGLSQDEWMRREAERNAARQEGNGYLTDYQANVLSQVGKRYEVVRDLQGKITSTEGTHESMQLMNSQMNVLLATTNQVLEHNTTMSQRSAAKDIEDAGRAKASNDNYNAWLESRKEATATSTRKIDSMGQSN